jgi:methyl-accepting chemotaxis protein PixJ
MPNQLLLSKNILVMTAINLSSTPAEKIQKFIRSNLILAIVTSFSLNLTLTATSNWSLWNTFQQLNTTAEKQNKLENLSDTLIYLDEVLTMSANMFATTGKPSWEKRYNDSVPGIDKTTTELFKNIPPSFEDTYKKFNVSTKELIGMEDQAFKLVKENKLIDATRILESDSYREQKKIYTASLQAIIGGIKSDAELQIARKKVAVDWSIYLELFSLGLLLLTASGIVIAVRGYVRDRQLAQDALQASQDSLQIVNIQLADESAQRQQQEKSTRQENQQLQQDVGELLDVVCEIESGNLTIQAQVNDRATGLVSDTLNRLIEALGRTLRQVSLAAQRVDSHSKVQKEMATTVAQSTSKQAQEISQMLVLTRKVRQSAENTLQQLGVTDRSLVKLQSSVTEGLETISNIDRDIEVLQAGSDRIVQEMKTLGEFVGLADRFVQDQSEIVTETQILALNASLVAARAAEQRDPKQFAAVAREFEMIATQVARLAQQTNEGLTSLEQRSSQIHKVVSSVDSDVQKMGGLVGTFTTGMKQANDVFATVQAVTAAAVESGNMLSKASQRIVSAADSTTVAIESISAFSQEIAHQSQDAQNLGDKLNILSTDLLVNIQIFQLPVVESESTAAIENVGLELAV